MVENLSFPHNLSPIVFTFRPILQVFVHPDDHRQITNQIHWLMVQQPSWKILVNGKDDIASMKWKIKPCSKPPV
jgi:hypothetical protein